MYYPKEIGIMFFANVAFYKLEEKKNLSYQILYYKYFAFPFILSLFIIMFCFPSINVQEHKNKNS
jgi:hypothetical protein